MTKRLSTSPAAALAVVLSCGSPLAFAASGCEIPSLGMAVPDGKAASAEQMTATQVAVASFVKAGEAYIGCVEASEQQATAQRKRDEMLDQLEKVAADFNRQLRQFKKSAKG